MEHAKLPLSWGTSLRFFIAKSFGSKKLHPFLVSLLININVLDEFRFGWPRQRTGLQLKKHLALNLQKAFNWVCMLIEFLSTCGSETFPLTYLQFLMGISSKSIQPFQYKTISLNDDVRLD